MTSFSYEVKQELSRIESDKCCQKAELSALIRMAGTIKIMGGKNRSVLQIKTEHAPTARKTYKLLKEFLKAPVNIAVRNNKVLRKHNLYIVSFNIKMAEGLLEELGIFNFDEDKFFPCHYIKPIIIQDICCKRAYLRGAFLGSGSISDPRKPYHIEFVTVSKSLAESLSNLINDLGLNSKVVERKNKYMVYLKDGDNISELLAHMGAHSSLLKFEDIRVCKDMRNNVNRIVNCETANLNKTVDASIRQIACINFLKERNFYSNLSLNLRQVADIRLEYPYLSLKELGQMMNPPLGKSGVSYRLKKIEKIAEALKRQQK